MRALPALSQLQSIQNTSRTAAIGTVCAGKSDIREVFADIIKVMDPRPLLVMIVLLGSAGVISVLLLTDDTPCSSTDQEKEARVTSGKSLPEEARVTPGKSLPEEASPGGSLETGANDKIKISANASLQNREVALPLTTAEVGGWSLAVYSTPF